MDIEPTKENKAIVNRAQRALSKAHDAANNDDYDYLCGDIRKLRGMLLTGHVDNRHLAKVKSHVNATRHDRKAKEIRTFAIKAFDLIAATEEPFEVPHNQIHL